MRNTIYPAAITTALASLCLASTVEYPGKTPGVATATQSDNTYTIGNSILSANFKYADGCVSFGGLKTASGTLLVKGNGPMFQITLGDGRKINSTDMEVTAPVIKELKGSKKALRASARLDGQSISATFKAPDGSFHVTWRAVLRDGSHYLRQEYTLKAGARAVPFT